MEVCAGGRLSNWVVESEFDASKLLQTPSNRAHRITILPLGKIQGRFIPSHLLEKVTQKASQYPGSCAIPASSIITLQNSKFSPIIDFIFGNIILTDNKELARAIAFDKAIRLKCITKEGDVYDPSGTMSGGTKNTNSTSSSSSTIIGCFSEYCDLGEKIGNIQKFMEENIRIPLQSHSSVSTSLETINHQLSLANDSIISFSKQLSGSDHFLKLKTLESDSINLDNFLKKKASLINLIKHLSERISNLSNERLLLSTAISHESKVLNITSEIEALKIQKIALEKEKNQVLETIAQEELAAKILAEERLLYEKTKTDLQTQLKESKLRLAVLDEDGKILQNSFSRAQEIDQTLKGELASEKNEENYLKEELSTVSLKMTQNESSIKKTQLELSSLNDGITFITITINDLLKEISQLASVSFTSFKNLSQNELDSKIEELRGNISRLRNEIEKKSAEVPFNSSKSKDSSLIQMIDSLERQESHLQKNLSRVKLDKKKIEEAIEKLNEFRTSALKDTFSRVNKDFGEIMGILLPHCFAELNINGESIADGITIRIRLGSVWKNSLSELSGGQR